MFSSASSRRVFCFWFGFALFAMGFMQFSQARAMGGIAGLLHVGQAHPVSALIAEEIPGLPMREGIGHDGQLFYAIALDLRGEFVPELIKGTESAPYRYRRIAYPALASGFGTLGGTALLWGMTVVNLVAAAIATGAAGLIARQFGRSPWLATAVLLNPGVWLSARLLTADNLALAFGLLAILAYLHRRTWVVVIALGLAVLTKEPALAFAASLAAHSWLRRERTRAITLALGSLIPVVGWWAYVGLTVGNPFESADNVVAPFAGIMAAIPTWSTIGFADALYLLFAALTVAGGSFVLFRARLFWRLIVAPWVLIAIISSELVWNFGNNAIRAFAPLFTLAILGLATGRSDAKSTVLWTPPAGSHVSN